MNKLPYSVFSLKAAYKISSTCFFVQWHQPANRYTDDEGGDSQVKRHKIVQQAHVIYLVRPLFVLFRERIEDFPNCRAPEVFYQVYSPPYVTH